ncbi:hypothetical protein K503DRAFT_609011 [Rhizopogon vinicolor AM-OR11-026]|uniref:Uncharacterized protein n=1 Tax=Rhizopogon vinicolor AM-OR11-026 TaxID=1314800 RepID=A0A1B7MIK6_9AGAM|nr:hypothetical protein K503DRAFT_609011 [Rhizopogon vinicolor AM-OR11-026]
MFEPLSLSASLRLFVHQNITSALLRVAYQKPTHLVCVGLWESFGKAKDIAFKSSRRSKLSSSHSWSSARISILPFVQCDFYFIISRPQRQSLIE